MASQSQDECSLQEKARQVIHAGELPNRRPDRTWGGPGIGAECAICRVPVQGHEVELELEFVRDGNRPGLDRYHMHVQCFTAWDLARARP